MGDSANRRDGARNFQPDSDVHVTLEDQGKINHFARCNAKNDDIKAELAVKKSQLQNIEDANDELGLLDSDSVVPFQCGEIFVYMDMAETSAALDATKQKLEANIKKLNEASNELKEKMRELKTHLYSKFGNRINLEEEEA